MIEKLSYDGFNSDMLQLCEKVVQKQGLAISRLTAILLKAKKDCSKWDKDSQKSWDDAVSEIAQAFEKDELTGEQKELLLAFLHCGFDNHTLRELYAGLARDTFSLYHNPIGLTEAIGIRDPQTTVVTIQKRWDVMAQIKMGVACFDKAFGCGVIVAVDDLANEVTIQMARKRVMNLQNFLDNAIIIESGSPLSNLLNHKGIGKYATPDAFVKTMLECLISAQDLPKNIIKKIVVPTIMTEANYTAMIDGKGVQLTATGKDGDGAQGKDGTRWDTSRSIAELVDRLKDTSNLAVENPNLNNIEGIFENASTREDQADFFAQAVAMIEKDGNFSVPLIKKLETLGAEAPVWNNDALFLEVSDKVPGKLAPFWFRVSYEIKGVEYLLDRTMRLPYRLWSHVEKVLNLIENGKIMLADRVYTAFENGKVNADIYFWLWKNAPESAQRTKYMSDSYLLFKTLHVEVRGSYLKSQRTLHKLLVDDEKFQRTVMDQGDPDAIRSLVRCVKHQPLLDVGECQALLVKIVRCYPESIREVEERGKAPARKAVGKITSIYSYEVAKLELDDIINIEIPENVAAIEHARGLGDLRENSEFKFAKERQALLNKQRNELETKLGETRSTNFRKAKVHGVIIPGSMIEVKYLKNDKKETFYLLGRMDGVPEENKISYETPLGKVLMGHKVNDKLEMPSGDHAMIQKVEKLPEEMLKLLESVPVKK